MKIFVYGTLMTGYENYNKYLIGKVKFISRATTKGMLYHIDKGYPGLVEGTGTVCGEMLEADDDYDVLKVLDRLEGFLGNKHTNNMYHRVLREVTNIETGEKLFLDVYVYETDSEVNSSDELTLVKSGDWREYMENSL